MMKYREIADQYNKLKIVAAVTGTIAAVSLFFAFIFPKINVDNSTENNPVLSSVSRTHMEQESLSNTFYDDIKNTESSISTEITTKFHKTTTHKVVNSTEKATDTYSPEELSKVLSEILDSSNDKKTTSTKPYTTKKVSVIQNTVNTTTRKNTTTRLVSSTTTQKATTVKSTEPTTAAPSILRVVGFDAVASVGDDGICRMYISGTVTSNYKIKTYVIQIHEVGCTLELEERCRNVYGTIKLPDNAVIIKNAQKGDVINVTITASDSSGREISVHDTVIVE